MNMKTDHRVDDDGTHHVLIEGLRVWVHKSSQQWVAQGIDIDYVTGGESQELAIKAFLFGLYLTIIEHVKRFGSIDRFASRAAPEEIRKAWIREVEMKRVYPRFVGLPLSETELGDHADDLPNVVPIELFEPAASGTASHAHC